MQLIKYSKVLDEMNRRGPDGKPVPFSIQVPTADRSRDTGGDRIIAEKAWLATKEGSDQVPSGNQKQDLASGSAAPKIRKVTRTIFIEGIDHPITINTRLLEIFNGQEVIY